MFNINNFSNHNFIYKSMHEYDYRCENCGIKILVYIKIPQIITYSVYAFDDIYFFTSIDELYNYKELLYCEEYQIKKLLE